MIWLLYNILFAVAYTLMLPNFLLRMKKRGGYAKGFLQRLGKYDSEILKILKTEQRIWIHAVSVGEVYIALKFMQELRERMSDAKFVLTTTTSTGHRIASDNLGDDDVLLYFPADFPHVIKKVLKIIKPSAIILTECELWPNLIRHANLNKIPVLLINGRISESSFRGYSKLRMFVSRILPMLDLLLVQSEQDKRFLVELGARSGKVHVSGTAKYDVAEFSDEGESGASEMLNTYGISKDNQILLGGSTWSGEEEVLIDIYKQIKAEHDGLKLVLVPRHMERRKEVEALLKGRKLRYSMRSNDSKDDESDILLVDTTGELKNLYACADLIFVGKSLGENHGGQNVIEAAQFSKPVIVGPNMENFPVVMNDFLESDAIIQVADAEGLVVSIKELLSNSEKRSDYGSRAGQVVRDKKGVVHSSVDEIMDVFSAS